MQKSGIAVWETLEIPQRRCARWLFPRRSIWVERIETEWHVLSHAQEIAQRDSSLMLVGRSLKPDSSQWRHYLHRDSGSVQPSPVLPDRPVVIRPDRALTLLPGQSTVFFLEIPVWFRLSTTGARPARIFEEPLAVLTRTWFGDPVTGELCWGLATRLHHSLDSVVASADRAVCPLMIENDSETDLEFQKICIHVENLSVFRGPGHLWTNSLHAVFRGPDQVTQIEIVHTPPGFEERLVPVSEAREPSAGWNIRRTFGVLKYFTDF
ncbi:MAG TPA: hypothetical protein VFI08_07635 [Spirochaetia bacterium]|nr:hypothetical protein [Spirochaetia bacterium]